MIFLRLRCITIRVFRDLHASQMELNRRTIITQYSRLSLQEGLRIAYVRALERDAHETSIQESRGQDDLEKTALIDQALLRIFEGPSTTGDLCHNCKAIEIESHLKRHRLVLSFGTLLEISTKKRVSFVLS